MRPIVFALILALTVSSTFAQKMTKAKPQQEFTISGIMQHTELEGGCWFLQAKNEKYELTGSPEDLRTCYVEGRPLVLRVVLRPFMASTCMIGKRVEVIAVLDTIFHARDAQIMTGRIVGTIHRTKAGCWYVRTKEGLRYEMQAPIPKRLKKIGKKYDAKTRFLEGNEGKCDMNGVLLLPDEPGPGPAHEKKMNDPH